MAKGLLAILAPKGKGSLMGGSEPDDDDEAPDSEGEDSAEGGFLAEMKSAAKDGDWDGFAEAVAGYVKACK